MAIKTTIVAFLLVLVINLSSSSEAAPENSSSNIYASFLECLQTNTKDNISSLIYAQDNAAFTSVLQAYIKNARLRNSSSKPLIIFTPTNVTHIQAAVVCSKKLGYQLKIRSGGHDYDGVSYISNEPFFILDMFNLRSIEVNMKDETAWVQAGATLGELYYNIWKKSKVHGFPAGVCPTVGVGGHISGGGYGNMLRKYGLTVDNTLDALFVDVNGRLMNRKAMGEDLFWAIRGGGAASFGVVIAYKVKLVPVPATVTVFNVQKTLDENATDMVVKWQSVAPRISNDLFMRMLVQPGNSKTQKNTKTIRVTIEAEYLGNADSLVALLGKEFPELGLNKTGCLEMSWIESVLWWANFDNGTAPEALLTRSSDDVKYGKRKSDYVQNPISKQNLELIWKKMIELGKTGLVFNPYGGRMWEIPASATPFPHRAGNLYKVQYSVNWNEGGKEAEQEYLRQIRELYSFTAPFVSKNPRSAFLNYRDLDIGVRTPGKDSYAEASVYGYKYFNGNFDRLVKVKTVVDPENFFRHQQSIPTLPKKA